MRLLAYKLGIMLVAIAVVALGCDQTPRSVSQAVAQLHEKEVSRRTSAALRLGDLGRFTEQPAEQQKAIAALEAALKDPSVRVRAAAASSLGEIGYPAKETVPNLVMLLRERDEIARNNAAAAIYYIAREAEDMRIPGSREAIKELLKALADSDEAVRGHAVGGLMALAPDDENVIKQVLVMLRDPHMNVRT